jgi:putative holliday junction resolvase
MRILAVDHGEKRIGIALSDETATIASPLKVVEHISRVIDASQVADLALQNNVALIVIGQSFDEHGKPNPAGRRAGRFADELKNQTKTPVELWDESFSTQDARSARLELGISRKNRGGHQDAFAAAVILQSYLDANRNSMVEHFKS